MPWVEKTKPTQFDATPPIGAWFLSGDVLAKPHHAEWMQGRKYPLITYPSGLLRELVDTDDEGGEVNVFGALQLKHRSTRNEALTRAAAFAEAYDYTVGRRGADELLLFHPHTGHGYTVKYDNTARQIIDIRRFPAHAMELLDGVGRALLPPLYSNEERGLNAVAPLKFFAPGIAWTWYPTEYDGENLFFGLVAGLEVELGYFSLTELEGVRGAFGLPLERDLYFTPTTLQELQRLHRGL